MSPLGCNGSQMDYCTNGQWTLTSAPVELVLDVRKEEGGFNSCVEKAKGEF